MMTKLSLFIRDNCERILADWETFARGLPAGASLDIPALRDHAKEMLHAIAVELETPRTPQQQSGETGGNTDAGAESSGPAREHGAQRAQKGFTVSEIVAEYRALRATVVRLWMGHVHELDAAALDELIRFSESLDNAIGESVARFNRDLNESRDRFLGILGHDLRAPLSAITMTASFLLDTSELDEPTRGHMNRIARSAKRMNLMVADILDFARTQFGGGTLPIAPVDMDLRALIDDVAAEVAASRRESEVRVEANGDLKGHWDSERLAQALTNLISNAVQHGSAKSAIVVAAHGMPAEVVISVNNQGAVITEERLSLIFSAMKQGPTDATGGTDHLGLGLYIVDSIVRAHGGTIDARSSADEGTTFTIHLPRQVRAAAA